MNLRVVRHAAAGAYQRRLGVALLGGGAVAIAACGGQTPTAHPVVSIPFQAPPCTASYVDKAGQLTVTVTTSGPAQVGVRAEGKTTQRASATVSASQTLVDLHLARPAELNSVVVSVLGPHGGAACEAKSAAGTPGQSATPSPGH